MINMDMVAAHMVAAVATGSVRKLVLAGSVSIIAAACNNGDIPDAYGNFEASEVIVSAEASGQLLWFNVSDGDVLAQDSVVGMIDTVQLSLEQRQLSALQSASGARTTEVARNIDALKIQLDIARKNYERIQRLHSNEAATTVQLEKAETDYKVLSKQLEAAQSQYQTVTQDVQVSKARSAQIDERLRKSQIVNPLSGTVLVSYAKAGEFVAPGQPLYKIAKLDSLDLRAYITEAQLSEVRIGGLAVVSVDAGGNKRRTLEGIVTWISSEAEFTPTPIQTREERTGLVYAVKIRVRNEDGIAKIGMPADVQFSVASSSR